MPRWRCSANRFATGIW